MLVKTLDLKEEYVFQPETYVKHLISSHSFLEGPVKVFSEVILEERHLKTLSSTLQGCSKTGKNINSSEILQREYRKRKLAVFFLFLVCIYPN